MSSLLDQETLALIDPAILHREVEIACGAHREDKNFRTVKAPFGQLLDGLLGTFRVGDKDGLCILSGGLVTPSGCQRIAKNVTRNHLMMFDHDTGVPVEDICAKIEALGYFAVVYTTYSHLKPATEVAESQVTKWLTKSGKKAGNDGSITSEQAADFLRENKKIVPEILADISRVERVMVAGKGVVYRITHAPMPRCRSVLVLKDPFDFAQRGTQAQAIAEWKEKYTRVAALIDGTFDSSCTDPSRLMYTPVKAPDAAPGTHEWYVVPGAMLDLDRLPPALGVGDDRFARFREQGAGAEDAVRLDLKTPNLAPFLRGYADDFEAQEWLLSVAPEDLRDNRGDRIAFCCPNEDNHTEINPQDQAFVTWNASSRPDGHGFHMLCMHDTCKTMSHDKRAWYLDLLCQKYGVEDAMELRAFCPRWEEEQEAAAERAEEARATGDDLRTRIEAITRDTPDNTITALVEEIATLPEGLETDLIIGALATKLRGRLGRSALQRAVDDARARRQSEATAEGSAAGGGGGVGGGNNNFVGGAPEVPDDPARTTVIWTNWDYEDQERCTEAAFRYHNERSPFVFSRPEGGACRVRKDKRGKLHIDPAEESSAWQHILTRILRFKTFNMDTGRERGVVPPPALIHHMQGANDLELPILERVVSVPVFSPEGTLHIKKGYDEALGVYLDPAMEFIPPPAAPTEDDVDDALWWLAETVRDFPFTDNFGGDAEDLPIRLDPPELDDDGFPLPNLERGRSSRLSFYAALLQPFARALIKGPCPAFHIDKPGAGTGATKLTSVISLIFEGREIDTKTLAKDDEEIRKTITSFLNTGGNILFFDNINHHVDSGALAGALTAGRWRDRVLTTSRDMDAKINALWVWAGNNVTFSHELMRRNVPIRLDAATPNPARDRGPDWYKHADLEGWIRENRAALVWACHTLIQNWVAKGRPAGSATLASFEDWAAVMSGILECAGVPEGVFLGNIGPYQGEKDDEAGAYDALVQQIEVTFKQQAWSTSDLLKSMEGKPFDNPLPDLGITHPNEHARMVMLGTVVTKHMLGKTFRTASGGLMKVVRCGNKRPSKYALLPLQ
jgi:hypothetical protein